MTTAAIDAFTRYLKANGVADPAPIVGLLVEVADEGGFSVEIYSGPHKNGEPREILDVNSIELTNFKGTAARTLDLLPGTTLVYGANDSGKSSLIEGLAFALAGAPAVGADQADVMKAGADLTRVTARATGAIITRQLDRSTKTRGKNAGEVTIDQALTVEIGGSKDTRTRNAQGLIDEWLGVPWSFVRRAMLVSQGELASILDEAPAKRREMFFQLLGLEGCESTRENLAKVLRKKEAQVVARAGSTEELNLRLAQAGARRGTFDLEKLRQEYHNLEAAGASSEALIKAKTEQLEAIRKQVSDYEVGIARRKGFLEEVALLQQSPALAAQITDVSVNLENLRRTATARAADVSRAEAALASLVEKGNRIKALPPVCPTCLELGWNCGSNEEVKQKKLGELREEWKKADEVLKAARSALVAIEGEVNALAKKNIENAALSQERARIQASVAAKEKLLALLPTEDEARHKLLLTNASVLAGEISGLRSSQPAETAARRADVHKMIAEAEKLDTEISWLTAEMKKLDSCIDRAYVNQVRDLVDHFSKGGLPLWLAKEHLRTINNRALELGTGDRYTYQFNDDLAVEIIDSDTKTKVPPSMASGSSRQRGALILRATLGRYLQELGGIKVPLFWIDEIPFQDGANAAMIVDVIKRLTAWYPKVVLAASQWDLYVGAFDHEVKVGPQCDIKTLQDLNVALADAHQATEAKAPKRTSKEESDAAFDALADKVEGGEGNILTNDEPPF